MQHETKQMLAEKLGVSVSSLYYKPLRPALDEEVKLQIESVLVDNPAYGHKRIALALKLNKKRILRVMKKFNLKPYRRSAAYEYKKRDRNNPPTSLPNISLTLCPIRPGMVWVSDFTSIKWQHKFLYLATIIDRYTREVVGIAVSRYHTKSLILNALEDALSTRSPPQYLHSDQGSEYRSQEYLNTCEKLGITVSMSDKSSPWQNGHQESFYGKFKVEFGDVSRFSELGALIEAFYAHIHYYNTKRIHTALKMTPQAMRENYYKLRGT